MKSPYPFAVILGLSSLLPLPAWSASVLNGGFQTGDFSGWSLDSDGFGNPSPSSDFSIAEPTPGNFAARLEADYAGNAVQFANTLYQSLDLAAQPNESLRLSFDWVFQGDAAASDEGFKVALGLVSGSGSLDYYNADGNLGFLLDQADYGQGSFSVLLNASFVNQTGWTLEFQLTRGFDNAGSYALIDNISLQAVPTPVPLPGTAWLFVSGLAGLLGLRQRNR